MRWIAGLLLGATLGCSADAALAPQDQNPLVIVNGALTLTVSDSPAMAGVLWIAPTADGGAGRITARAIRYGSLCATSVSGRVDVAGNVVSLHVAYTARTAALCTMELRALQYDATVAPLAPGQYEVHIYHADGTGEVEVRKQTVTVT